MSTLSLISENAWDSAKSKYLTNHGGWIFSASPSGSPIDTHCYVYERAFTIMALSALSQATGKSEYEDEINVALNWLKTYCGAEHGGYNLGVPFDPSVPREQNPHMHLFEACMDGKDLCGGELAEIAKQLFELSIAHFISTTGALIEFFTQDWQPDPKTGKDYQPGHLMEWTWLLSQYSKTIQKDVPEVTKLYESACSWGLDSIGFGYDEVREGGDILRSTKRIWVQCEVLKGHCARFESTKEEVYLDRAQSVLANIFEHYLHEKTGSWYDQLNNKNENISKNAPASTMYHLLLALHEFLRVTD
jgi:mannose-6-phosphate isomerase